MEKLETLILAIPQSLFKMRRNGNDSRWPRSDSEFHYNLDRMHRIWHVLLGKSLVPERAGACHDCYLPPTGSPEGERR